MAVGILMQRRQRTWPFRQGYSGSVSGYDTGLEQPLYGLTPPRLSQQNSSCPVFHWDVSVLYKQLWRCAIYVRLDSDIPVFSDDVRVVAAIGRPNKKTVTSELFFARKQPPVALLGYSHIQDGLHIPESVNYFTSVAALASAHNWNSDPLPDELFAAGEFDQFLMPSTS